MKRPSELSVLLYGGGALTAAGAAFVYPPAGLIVLGSWFGAMGVLYVLGVK